MESPRKTVKFEDEQDTGNNFYIIPSTFGLNSDLSEEDLEMINALEKKRAQLDAQITLYVQEKQNEYDAYAKEIFTGDMEKSENIIRNVEVKLSEEVASLSRYAASRNERHPLKNKPTPIEISHSDEKVFEDPKKIGDDYPERTPIREREMELAGLFTPSFLPLMDSSYAQRTKSAPEFSFDGEDHDNEKPKKSPKRTSSDPSGRPPHLRKSSIRDSKSPSRKKRVSLVVDDQVFRPSETPEVGDVESPLESEPKSIQIDLEKSDGSLIKAWVPEKAREKSAHEDAMEYLDAVGGTVRAASGVVSPPPEETEEDDLNSSEDATDEDGNYFDLPAARQDSPTASSSSSSPKTVQAAYGTTPTTSPPLTIRHMSPTKTASPVTPSFSSVLDHRKHIDSMTPVSTAVEEQPPFPLDNRNGPSSSYVGGIGGSGIDDVDNASVGYPSSLGVSYMEQFAAKRAAHSEVTTASPEKVVEDERKKGPKDHRKGKQKQRDNSIRQQTKIDDDQFMGDMEEL